jgi:gliding motility-associated-like protein
MKKISLLFFIIIGLYPSIIKAQGGDCSTAAPFCSGTTYTFPASTNTISQVGPNYGCLFTQPNPAWYYLQIANSGNVVLAISQTDASGNGADVDFICWGPFTSPAAGCASGLTGAAVDCSYSPDAIETCTINNAINGEFYLLLLTNFSGAVANISLSQSNLTDPGAGSTNCNILCSMTSITAAAGDCDMNTITYGVTGKVYYTNPPTSGTLTISSSCSGVTQVFNAPFSADSVSYSLTGLPCNSDTCTVTAVFSGDQFCTDNQNYVAPTGVIPHCDVNAANNAPFCAGNQLNLTASDVTGATYSWAGPNGYTSSVQNPTISTTTSPMAGTYTVTVTVASPHCVDTATTVVDILPAANANFMVTPNQIYTLDPIAYFNNLSDSSTSWFWDFGDTTTSTIRNPNHTYKNIGTYTVKLNAYNPSGCNDSMTLLVTVQDIVTLYIPTAFSPNNPNEVNDNFKISSYGIAADHFEMWIFNRWGNQLFYTRDITQGWDGTINNKGGLVELQDTYVYRINYKDEGGKIHTCVGPVTLLR